MPLTQLTLRLDTNYKGRWSSKVWTKDEADLQSLYDIITTRITSRKSVFGVYDEGRTQFQHRMLPRSENTIALKTAHLDLHLNIRPYAMKLRKFLLPCNRNKRLSASPFNSFNSIL